MTAAFDLPRAIQQTLTYDLATPTGYRALLVYLMDLLDWADFQIIEQAASFSDTESTNLIGLRGPYTRGGLLLSTAIRPQGTADATQWTVTEENPRNSTWRDGALYAHGATAGLPDLLIKAHAASRIDRNEYKQPLILAGLFGSAAHVSGIMHLMDSGVCAPDMALVGAGTNLELAHTHPGELDLRIEICQTKTSPPAGEYTYDAELTGPMNTDAISRANRVGRTLKAIHSLRQQCVFSVHQLSAAHDKPPTFSIATNEATPPRSPDLKFHLARTTPGSAEDTILSAFTAISPRLMQLVRWHRPLWSRVNSAPSLFSAIRPVRDGLEFALQHWPLPGENTEVLVQDVRSEVQRLLPEHLVSRVDIARSVLPFDAAGKGRLLKTCRRGLYRLGIPPVTGHFPLATEAWLLPAYQVETVVFGPGRQAELHGRGNEHVPLNHIERAADLYEYVIRRMCCR